MNKLRALLENDATVVAGWSGVPGDYYLAALARTAFGAITFDMQHGLLSEQSVISGITAIAAHSKPVIVRIPVGRFDFASRALDSGASAIIAPMVNTLEDARKFAEFVKYPPIGERSFGPAQAANLLSQSDAIAYVKVANAQTISLAMVETAEAVANLEGILAVDGIDGVLVGPADLSISVRQIAVPDAFGEETIQLLADIAKKTRNVGKIAATYCVGPENVIRAHDMGYRLIAMGNDDAYLRDGANTMLAQLPFRAN